MKNFKTVSLFFLSALFATSAFASGNYRLSCDDNNIFEGPMTISIRGAQASASGNFSGPGDAIFSVSYRKLDVLDLRTNGNSIEELSLTQAVVAKLKPGFRLTLKANAKGELNGYVHMTSTDEDKMDYDGEISCEVKAL